MIQHILPAYALFSCNYLEGNVIKTEIAVNS
jgi:hypothetical protein